MPVEEQLSSGGARQRRHCPGARRPNRPGRRQLLVDRGTLEPGPATSPTTGVSWSRPTVRDWW